MILTGETDVLGEKQGKLTY